MCAANHVKCGFFFLLAAIEGHPTEHVRYSFVLKGIDDFFCDFYFKASNFAFVIRCSNVSAGI